MTEGGKRLKGIKPGVWEKFPIISVITVVYNSENLIEKTIKSILSQTYENIEFIVVDGNSKDNTLEIIKKYDQEIDYWISESDRGLYDAMNKGLELASGDYLWFINSGDLIYSDDTLKEIFKERKNYSDIYYGDTLVVDDKYEAIGLRRHRPPKVLSWKSFRNGMLVCHQSIIIKKELCEPYNLSLKHSSDYEWVLKALKKADQIRNTEMILSRFLDGGHSKQNILPSLKERFKVMMEHYGFFPTILSHFKIAVKFLKFWRKEGWF